MDRLGVDWLLIGRQQEPPYHEYINMSSVYNQYNIINTYVIILILTDLHPLLISLL